MRHLWNKAKCEVRQRPTDDSELQHSRVDFGNNKQRRGSLSQIGKGQVEVRES